MSLMGWLDTNYVYLLAEMFSFFKDYFLVALSKLDAVLTKIRCVVVDDSFGIGVVNLIHDIALLTADAWIVYSGFFNN